MKKLKSSILSVLAFSSILSTHASDSNLVMAAANTNKQIGEQDVKFQIISKKVLKQKSASKDILPISSPITMQKLRSLPQAEKAAENFEGAKSSSPQAAHAEETSLLIGIPVGLIGEQNIFGGVITKVSDKKNDTLGSLKLTDLPPLHVRSAVSQTKEGIPVLTLIGCANACDEEAKQQSLINLPIAGYNPETEMIIIDMSAIGKGLDLVSMMDSDSEYTRLKAIGSETVAVDYSQSTLIFDIKTKMVPVTEEYMAIPAEFREMMPMTPAADAPVTEFTVRWYLKLNSAFNPAFTARPATAGVGFFQTDRSKNPKITRFSTTNNGSTVKYYLKNIPEQYKKTFAGALDNWNKQFTATIGRNLLSYEFIDANDPRSAEYVTGDIRYNIIEWDLNNIASYGGLGPSIANQYTGETLSANVLIQGPMIIDLYTKWYEISKKAEALEAIDKAKEAMEILFKFNQDAKKTVASRKASKLSIKLGKDLPLTVHTQREELEDPMFKTHFEKFPSGVSFEKYMTGYFTEMLEHEIGHNVGLRHNFKGNLGSYESTKSGSVSRSIMEYLGRPYRHLNAIGLYDKMAINYGYKGVAPKHLDWFCTDEDQATEKTMALKSAECTKSDATSDPYSFFEERLARSIELLVDTHSSSAPVWSAKELATQIDEAVTGLAAYAASAEKTASTWTNFFGKADRPETAAEVKGYVLESVKKQLCAPELASILNSKESAEARKAAEDNLVAITVAFAEKTMPFGLYKTDDIVCK